MRQFGEEFLTLLSIGEEFQQVFACHLEKSFWLSINDVVNEQRCCVLEVQLVQPVFHKEQVCTCEQVEVWLSQQHGRLWKIPQQQQQPAALQCLQFLSN